MCFFFWGLLTNFWFFGNFFSLLSRLQFFRYFSNLSSFRVIIQFWLNVRFMNLHLIQASLFCQSLHSRVCCKNLSNEVQDIAILLSYHNLARVVSAESFGWRSSLLKHLNRSKALASRYEFKKQLSDLVPLINRILFKVCCILALRICIKKILHSLVTNNSFDYWSLECCV